MYILANKTRSVFYVGVTENIQARLYQHKNGIVDGFTNKYNIHTLVYFEEYSNINEAIAREKQLKNWHRQWKLNLIKTKNPKFDDLSKGW